MNDRDKDLTLVRHDRDVARKERDDLALLRRFIEDSESCVKTLNMKQTCRDATDYLKRHGLEGSPLH